MLDPTHTIGLQSLDFGSVYSPDGRDHPLLALTPIFAQDSSQASTSQPTSTGGDVPSTSLYATASGPGSAIGSAVGSAVSSVLPPHFGARLAVSVIAIAILLIVVARLLLK